ncbi:MAG TPA: hypothetical protein PK156_07060 [Polyangium sp.]|nr:hypothetical protein [Polyangium sp.]
MTEPTKEELLETKAGTFDTNQLAFTGLRGDASKHLDRARLEAAIAALPPAPLDEGLVELLVARGPEGERILPREVMLTVEGGMPGDRWADASSDDPDSQLATARADVARVIANGQPLELHGDNLYLHLDISPDNLPPGTTVRLGQALLRVTPRAHNGCKKWVQRFGLDAMQLNVAQSHRAMRVRGIYLQVIENGLVAVGDRAVVVERARAPAEVPEQASG